MGQSHSPSTNHSPIGRGRVIHRQQTTLLSEGQSYSPSTNHSPIGWAESFTVNNPFSYRRGRVIHRQQTTLLSEGQFFTVNKPLSYRRDRVIQRQQTTLLSEGQSHSTSENHSPIGGAESFNVKQTTSPIGGAESFNVSKPLSYRRGRVLHRQQTTPPTPVGGAVIQKYPTSQETRTYLSIDHKLRSQPQRS